MTLLAGSSADGAGSEARLSRERADSIAVRVLRPQADKGEVILFGLTKPLATGSYVMAADPPKGSPLRTTRVPIRRLRGRAWLYWLDRDPYSRFSHDSEYLLVDDRTGRVVERARIGWYPTINGKDPPFLTLGGYESRQYRVFTRVAPQMRSIAAAHRDSTADALPPGAFANDCVLMFGDYHDAATRNDFPAVRSWAGSVGLRAQYTTPAGPRNSPQGEPPDAGDLEANVKRLVDAERCQDILIYMSGHGVKAGSGPPAVMAGKRIRPLPSAPFVEVQHVGVTAEDLERIVHAHPQTTFKVKIDSCFSGRFLEELTVNGKLPQENLLIVEVSSQANRLSQSRGDRRDSPYPERIGTFTRQNLVGLKTWAASEDEVASSLALGGSLLAHALERGFVLGRSANRSIRTKGIVPQIATNFLTLSFTRTSWLHGQGSSTACAEVKSESGTSVNVAVTTNASVPPQPALKTVQTGANGLAVASFRIFRAAQYAFGAAARKGVRTAKAEPARLTVPFPAQPPAGSLACPSP